MKNIAKSPVPIPSASRIKTLRLLMALAVSVCMFLGTAARAGDFYLLAAGLDSIENTVAKEITGLDYTTYQATRLRLQENKGKGFDSKLHGTVARQPFCTDADTPQEWLNQNCQMLKVVASKEYCKDHDQGCGYCIAFRMAPFILRQPELLGAAEKGITHLGADSPSTESLLELFGLANLQAPGMALSPYAGRLAQNSLKVSGRKPKLARLPNDVFVCTLYHP